MADVLIPHIVHMTYFDYTLPILQNFEKTKMSKMFSQSFEELAKCSQNMSCGQCEVLTHLPYRRILKSIVKKLEEKNQKISHFGT